MDRRLEVEQLRRSIAMLAPGARDAVGREDALHLLGELGDVQGRLDDLNGGCGSWPTAPEGPRDPRKRHVADGL